MSVKLRRLKRLINQPTGRVAVNACLRVVLYISFPKNSQHLWKTETDDRLLCMLLNGPKQEEAPRISALCMFVIGLGERRSALDIPRVEFVGNQGCAREKFRESEIRFPIGFLRGQWPDLFVPERWVGWLQSLKTRHPRRVLHVCLGEAYWCGESDSCTVRSTLYVKHRSRKLCSTYRMVSDSSCRDDFKQVGSRSRIITGHMSEWHFLWPTNWTLVQCTIDNLKLWTRS